MPTLYHRNGRPYIKASFAGGTVAVSLDKYGTAPSEYTKNLLQHIIHEVRVAMPGKSFSELRQIVKENFVRELIRQKRALLGTGEPDSPALPSCNDNRAAQLEVHYAQELLARVAAMQAQLFRGEEPSIDVQVQSAQQTRAEVQPVQSGKTGLTVADIRKHWQEYRDENVRAENWRTSTTGTVQQDGQFSAFDKTFLSTLDDSTVFDKGTARSYKARMHELPVGWARSMRYGKTLQELLDSVDEDTDTLSVNTINQQIRNLGTFWRWMIRQEYTEVNIWDGLTIRVRSGVNHRALSTDAVQIIKEGCKGESGRARLMPLLGLYTGARVGELSQLHTRDIDIDARTMTITDGDGQQIKNSTSRRTIPIPEQIADEFVRYVQALPEGSIWPEVTGKTLNDKRVAMTAWFSAKFREQIGDTFHSLRHTFITEAHRANGKESVIYDLVGHTQGGVHNKVYRATASIEQMREVQAALPY